MHKKLFICIIAILTAFAAKAQLYYDENGNYVDLEDATDLSNGLTSLKTGSYRIWFDNIEYTNLDINGDVKLYLCYNGVITAEKITILYGSKLTIYDGEGSLTCQELNVNGTLNVIGGNITVNDEGITGSGNIIINGGQVTTSAIEANKLTIGWKKANDYFKADNFSVSSISIIDPQLFIVNNVEYKGELSAGEISSFVANIKGKELTPPSLQFDKDYILNHLPPVKQDLVYNGEEQELLDLTNYTFPTIEGGELLFSENGTDWVQNPTASRAYTHWITIKIQSQNESVYPSVILEKQLMVNIQSSETFDDEFFEYVVIDPNQKYVEISGRTYFAEFNDKLEIPSKVLHSGVYYTVTQIGESALNEMKNGSEGSPNVETIFFPNSIKRICKNAFINNTALKSIELEDGTELTFIGETAFENCAFTNIEIPKQVTLGLNAFDNQFIDGNFNLTINWNQLSENSVLPCQKNDKYTRTLTIPPCASATDFESWGDVFEIKGGISSVSAETFDKLTFTKEYDKKAELSFDDNPITTINGNNLVITKIQLGELEEDRFFKESADAGKKVAKVSFNLLGNDNSKICPNDFDILLSQNEALIKPKDISEDIKELINKEKIYDQGRWATLTTGEAITTSTPVQDGFVNFVKLEDGIEFSFIQAEYNSKNVIEASTITIAGSPNSTNYTFPEKGITIDGVIKPKQLTPSVTLTEDDVFIKQYDGTAELSEGFDNAFVISLNKEESDFLANDQLSIIINNVSYSSKDASDEPIPLLYNLELQGNDDHKANYSIDYDYNAQQFFGKITPKVLDFSGEKGIPSDYVKTEKTYDSTPAIIFQNINCEQVEYQTGLLDENGKPIIVTTKLSGEYYNQGEPVSDAGNGYQIFIKPELAEPNPNFKFEPEIVQLENLEGKILPKTITATNLPISNTKVYDGTATVFLNNGTSLPLNANEDKPYQINDDIRIISAKYNSNNISADNITIGCEPTSSNYTLENNGSISIEASITPKPISIKANFPENFKISKRFDGNIDIPQDIELISYFSIQDIIDPDEVSFKNISANYENADPSPTKNVVFSFVLSNDNYKVEKTAFEIGEIKPDQIIINEDGITQVDTKERFCAEAFGNIQLQFSVVDGKPMYYKIYDIPGISSNPQVVDEGQNDIYIINIGVMSDLKSGIYNGKIDFFADEDCTIRQNQEPYNFSIIVYLPDNVVKQLYHNVLFVDNHDSAFYQYQWYKNDQKIDGEIKQYITERPELTGKYSVEILIASGIKLHSCNYSYNDATAKRTITITPYPNPVKAGQPFALKIIGGVSENASIMIFNNAGAQIKRIDNITEHTQITLPSGYYSGALIYDGQKSGFKIIVE